MILNRAIGHVCIIWSAGRGDKNLKAKLLGVDQTGVMLEIVSGWSVADTGKSYFLPWGKNPDILEWENDPWDAPGEQPDCGPLGF